MAGFREQIVEAELPIVTFAVLSSLFLLTIVVEAPAVSWMVDKSPQGTSLFWHGWYIVVPGNPGGGEMMKHYYEYPPPAGGGVGR